MGDTEVEKTDIQVLLVGSRTPTQLHFFPRILVHLKHFQRLYLSS
jgi:hypothetical protein